MLLCLLLELADLVGKCLQLILEPGIVLLNL